MTIEVEDGKMVISRAPDVLFSSRQTRLTLRLDGEDLNTVVLQEFEDVKEVNIESMLPTVNAFGREVRAGSVEASRLEIHSSEGVLNGESATMAVPLELPELSCQLTDIEQIDEYTCILRHHWSDGVQSETENEFESHDQALDHLNKHYPTSIVSGRVGVLEICDEEAMWIIRHDEAGWGAAPMEGKLVDLELGSEGAWYVTVEWDNGIQTEVPLELTDPSDSEDIERAMADERLEHCTATEFKVQDERDWSKMHHISYVEGAWEVNSLEGQLIGVQPESYQSLDQWGEGSFPSSANTQLRLYVDFLEADGSSISGPIIPHDVLESKERFEFVVNELQSFFKQGNVPKPTQVEVKLEHSTLYVVISSSGVEVEIQSAEAELSSIGLTHVRTLKGFRSDVEVVFDVGRETHRFSRKIQSSKDVPHAVEDMLWEGLANGMDVRADASKSSRFHDNNRNAVLDVVVDLRDLSVQVEHPEDHTELYWSHSDKTLALCTLGRRILSFRDNILRTTSASAIDEFQNKMRENGQALETVNLPLRLYSDSDYAPPYIQFDDQHKGFIFDTETPAFIREMLSGKAPRRWDEDTFWDRVNHEEVRFHFDYTPAFFGTVKVVYHTKNWERFVVGLLSNENVFVREQRKSIQFASLPKGLTSRQQSNLQHLLLNPEQRAVAHHRERFGTSNMLVYNASKAGVPTEMIATWLQRDGTCRIVEVI